MNKLLVKTKLAKDKFMRNAKRVIKNTEGDQITGWLIVILYCCCSRRVLHEKLSGRNRGGLGRSNR